MFTTSGTGIQNCNMEAHLITRAFERFICVIKYYIIKPSSKLLKSGRKEA